MKKQYSIYFFGGASYGCPSLGLDAPDFRCSFLREARDFLSAIPGNRRFPCVSPIPPESGGPELWIFSGDSRDYPDFRIYFGPRGGVRSERC